MNSQKIFKTRDEILSYVMESVKADPLIPEDAKMRVRHYMAVTYGACFEMLNKSSKHIKPIRAISPKGHTLGEWNTIVEAAEEMNIDRHSIQRCLKNGRAMVRSRLNGIKWEYIK